jgi:tRNA threonylcarbamoyladenosine biosynthesis protein TsaB
MNLLAIDTAARLCAACVLDTETGRELGREVLDLGKGHAEQLMDVIEAALSDAGVGYADLGMVAVSVGPGSFTGVRVGVSAARGLALALGIPVVGVSSLEALAASARDDHPGHDILVLLEAGRGGIYAARYDADGLESVPPGLIDAAQAADLARAGEPILAGSAADAVRDAVGRDLPIVLRQGTADIATYARVAARRGLPGRAASPLYLRAADAKPQAGFALPRRNEP